MDSGRFSAIVGRYASLRIAVLGDFCLDRYLEIDPARREVSLETGLPVHNVVNVRPQAGGAGTIVSNLAALGVGTIFPVGFAGRDGEGYELSQALESLPGVRMSHFVSTRDRRTFTYCKPLVMEAGHPPVELNRLDLKNWSPTSAWLQGLLVEQLRSAAATADAVIVLDQVDIPETGVVTQKVLAALKVLAEARPELPVLADSRRGLRGFPPVIFKMNAAELSTLTGAGGEMSPDQVEAAAAALAAKNGREVFVTLAARGILGATPGTLHASGGRDQRASVSPSPPPEERGGERRPAVDAAVGGDVPSDFSTGVMGVLSKAGGLLSLALSSKGGEGTTAAADVQQDACKEQTTPAAKVEYIPALPLRGEIDIVGAGDAVSANLATALAAGASLGEALELANAAASIVIHKLGTTGTARIDEIRELLAAVMT